MRKINRNQLIVFFIMVIPVLFYSCGNDVAGSNSNDNSISGTVSYIDSGFYFNSLYYYAVCIYGDSTTPLSHTPISIDSVQINLQSKTAYYKVSGLSPGNYYAASTYIRRSDKVVASLLGSYGCDTSPNCPNLKIINVPSSAGNGGCNFLSKTH
ncbi:MAG: hypothetical protein ACHQJ4_07610 [Ignavibacteria bacterium]